MRASYKNLLRIVSLFLVLFQPLVIYAQNNSQKLTNSNGGMALPDAFIKSLLETFATLVLVSFSIGIVKFLLSRRIQHTSSKDEITDSSTDSTISVTQPNDKELLIPEAPVMKKSDLQRTSFKRAFFILLGLFMVTILAFILLITLLAYNDNEKGYYNYSCVDNLNNHELSTAVYNDRWSKLLWDYKWVERFSPDVSYCSGKYESFVDNACDFGKWDYNLETQSMGSSNEDYYYCYDDPLCNVSSVIKAKKIEYKDYLESTEKDQVYWEYVNRVCSN